MKSTRGFYRKKILLFGMFIFISIALISTGFAAWVISSNTSQDGNGNVNVGLVSEGKLTIEGFKITNKDFTFEPLESDTNGRVRNDGTNFESLETTVTATIKPTEFLGEVVVEFLVPQGVVDAVNQGYIKYKGSTHTADAVVTEYGKGGYKFSLTPEQSKAGTYELTEVLGFEWGEKFGNQNPGTYYDDTTEGQQVSDADMVKALEDFRAILFGYYNEFNGENRKEVIEKHKDATLQFGIKITASVN